MFLNIASFLASTGLVCLTGYSLAMKRLREKQDNILDLYQNYAVLQDKVLVPDKAGKQTVADPPVKAANAPGGGAQGVDEGDTPFKGLKCGMYAASAQGARDENTRKLVKASRAYLEAVHDYVAHWHLWEEIQAQAAKDKTLSSIVSVATSMLPFEIDWQKCLKNVVKQLPGEKLTDSVIRELLAYRRERTIMRCGNVFFTAAPVEVALDRKEAPANWREVIRGEVALLPDSLLRPFHLVVQCAKEELKDDRSVGFSDKDLAYFARNSGIAPETIPILTEEEAENLDRGGAVKDLAELCKTSQAIQQRLALAPAGKTPT